MNEVEPIHKMRVGTFLDGVMGQLRKGPMRQREVITRCLADHGSTVNVWDNAVINGVGRKLIHRVDKGTKLSLTKNGRAWLRQRDEQAERLGLQ